MDTASFNFLHVVFCSFAPAYALAYPPSYLFFLQEERLFGATLLILANKQDIPSALSLQEIEEVGRSGHPSCAACMLQQTRQMRLAKHTCTLKQRFVCKCLHMLMQCVGSQPGHCYSAVLGRGSGEHGLSSATQYVRVSSQDCTSEVLQHGHIQQGVPANSVT